MRKRSVSNNKALSRNGNQPLVLPKSHTSSIRNSCRNTCYNVKLSYYPQLEIILTLDFAENMLV
ncbi:hypothetical protein [Lysinibacillus xylanilyticus]|uniref:hypothetical protein n=1 Tax=Lysinibacillus xylanilyticus TaxID=582475 RepID=UPI003D038938